MCYNASELEELLNVGTIFCQLSESTAESGHGSFTPALMRPLNVNCHPLVFKCKASTQPRCRVQRQLVGGLSIAKASSGMGGRFNLD